MLLPASQNEHSENTKAVTLRTKGIQAKLLDY